MLSSPANILKPPSLMTCLLGHYVRFTLTRWFDFATLNVLDKDKYSESERTQLVIGKILVHAKDPRILGS